MASISLLSAQFTQELTWLTSRRWFGDKARPVISVEVDVADEVDANGAQVMLCIVRCAFEWGPESTYFVPVIAGDGPISERDATSDPQFLQWLVDGFADDRHLEVEVRWRWRRIGESFPDTSAIDYARASAISGEQSNTSIVFDGAFIGKVFRKVSPGVNPDLEIGEHMMRLGTVEEVPALFGVIELYRGDERTDIMAIQEFVANEGDGWSWILQTLAEPANRTQLVTDIALLGTRTGEMHLALSQDVGDPAFTPIVIGEDEAQTIIRRVIAEMEGSVEGLTHVLTPPQVAELHRGLGTMMGDAWTMVGTELIRVHGDYHLGQTLRTVGGDFAIIDFEGEPSRTMDERRQKLPALKDVAGMLRSLDYAGATLIQQANDPLERQALADWVQEASAAFVAAYRDAIAGSATRLVPESDEAFAGVLNLMIAEKALYETRYELNNRPDWLWIPLGALLRLVGMELT